jgi:hypothetical protein
MVEEEAEDIAVVLLAVALPFLNNAFVDLTLISQATGKHTLAARPTFDCAKSQAVPSENAVPPVIALL